MQEDRKQTKNRYRIRDRAFDEVSYASFDAVCTSMFESFRKYYIRIPKGTNLVS